VVAKHRCLCGTEPLRATLEQLFRGARYEEFSNNPIACVIASTDLTRGKRVFQFKRGERRQVSLPPDWAEIRSEEHLMEALMSTTALPLLFPHHLNRFDGGVLTNQPMMAALHFGVKRLYVLLPTPEGSRKVDHLMDIGSAVIAQIMEDGFQAELDRVKERNRVPDTAIQVGTIRPRAHLPSGLLAFGQNVADLVDRGRRDALLHFQRLDGDNLGGWDAAPPVIPGNPPQQPAPIIPSTVE
jgi:predicted acylesterase/phospholipase RssA